jgi:single-stranded DNA-binding protein
LGSAGLAPGKKIALIGQFRSYNKIVDEKSKLMLTVFVRDFCEPDDDNPNVVTLAGYICKPPIYRTTPFNREICDMLIAVNRAYNKSDYIPCIAWGRNARFVKNMEVGHKMKVSGRIQSREYIKKLSDTESETRVAYELSINKIELDDGTSPTAEPLYGTRSADTLTDPTAVVKSQTYFATDATTEVKADAETAATAEVKADAEVKTEAVAEVKTDTRAAEVKADTEVKAETAEVKADLEVKAETRAAEVKEEIKE